MNKNIRLFVFLLLLLSAISAKATVRYDPVDSNVSYGSVTGLGFDNADFKLVYGDINPDLQYGLLWLPKGPTVVEKAPLIVLIHGGCWLNEYDIQHSYALSTALAEAGYGVWSLEYRRTGDAGGGWPGTFEDIKQGLAFSSSLQSYSLDLDRVVIIGHSAGGQLALLAGAEFQDIDGVIGLAAITDIVEYSRGENSCQSVTDDFMGGSFEMNPTAYEAANPVNQPLHTNTVLLQGNSDQIVPPEQASLPGATTRALEDAGHFDWIHPGTDAYRLLLSTLEDIFQK
jgi:acetyl esterase/lipase